MTKKIISVMLGMCLFALVLGCAPAAPPAPAEEPIKIGVLGPMKNVAGESIWHGAILAKEEINEAGGVLVAGVSRPIELIQVDTNEFASIPDAVSATERAITVDKADFLVGGRVSEAGLAMQDVCMGYKKIFIGTGTAHPEICARVAKDYDKYKYTFRVIINSYYMGGIMLAQLADTADLVREELGIEKPKVAILADQALWCEPAVAAAEAKIPEMGLELVGTWRMAFAATDVTPELTAIKASGAQIIYRTIAGPGAVVADRQLGELKIPAVLVGGNALGGLKGFWEATGGYANYSVIMMGYGPAKMTEKTIPFWNKFIERFDEFPGYEASSYDAIYVLKGAVERAGTLDSDAVVVELEKTDYMGAAGRIAFYPANHEQWPHDLMFGPEYVTWCFFQWLDGDVKVVWPYGWEGVTYEGSQKLQLPPWMVEYWKK